MANTTVKSNGRHLRLHPLALRVMHWINAVAMIIMIMSGWAIYNDEVIFGALHFRHGPRWETGRKARCNGTFWQCGS
jgi:thiosulfate reductase cytochrome b subunit